MALRNCELHARNDDDDGAAVLVDRERRTMHKFVCLVLSFYYSVFVYFVAHRCTPLLHCLGPLSLLSSLG